MAELVPVYDSYVPPGWIMLAKARLEAPGARTAELASVVGVSTHLIKRWLGLPDYQRYEYWLTNKTFDPRPPDHMYGGGGPATLPVKVRVEKLKEEIGEYTVEMWDRLKQIMDTTEDEKLIVSTTQDLLDRAGHSAVRTIQHQKAGAMVMTPELLAILQRRALEAGEAPIIDAVVVEPVGEAKEAIPAT